jgi:DNA-binding PadR family transcriptional regulator
MVPKGFVRYHVLESLSRKPMSGSEIMSEIEKSTNGRWRPSPGSIYPLLAWLQDNGYVRELPTDESGMKRYELSDNGRRMLEEQRKIRKDFREEGSFFGPPFLGALLFRIPPEKSLQVRESIGRLMKALFMLGIDLEERFSEETIEEASGILGETAEKLEKLDKKLRGKKNG